MSVLDMQGEGMFVFRAIMAKIAIEFGFNAALVSQMIVQMFLVHITTSAFRAMEFTQIIHRMFVRVVAFEIADVDEIFVANPALEGPFLGVHLEGKGVKRPRVLLQFRNM